MTDGICKHASSEEGKEKSMCTEAGVGTDDARETMPAGPSISEGSEDGVPAEDCPGAVMASSIATKSRGCQSKTDDADGSDKHAGGRDERRKDEGEDAGAVRRGGVLSAAEGGKAVQEGGKAANAALALEPDAAATSPTPVKRKKKEKTVSRLSFSDEIGVEDGDGEAGSEFGSISQSTTKRCFSILLSAPPLAICCCYCGCFCMPLSHTPVIITQLPGRED